MKNKENILGLDVTTFTSTELMADVNTKIKEGQKLSLVAVNPEKILLAKKDAALTNLINSFDYQIPDGSGVIWASKRNKGQIKERITGIDTMLSLCELSAKYGHSIFLYGASPGTAKNAAEKLRKDYPGINIVGTLDGYVKDEEFIISTINKLKPNILFVALGSPKQELWIQKYKNQLDVNVFQGVGGSYDVISGKIKRAPDIMQQYGLEWLYRFLKQPSRYKRYVKLFSFITLMVREKRRI